MGRLAVLSLKLAPILAAASFAVAAVVFGAALDGYSQALHPLALLGAKGFPNAPAFNACAFVLPGALAALAAIGLRAALPRHSPWPLRIGAQVLLLAALAFAAMGALPLDVAELEGQASRLHGAAWMLWCVAFAVGGLLLGFGWLRAGSGPATATFAAVAAAVFAAFFLPALVAPGVAQRLAFAVWWLWLAGIGWRMAGAGARPAALR
ncbi:MAG: DUF998 domain-containing protein [Pseudoxanthomonas sp.]